MNRMQEETKAIQETLGVIPQRATNNPGGLTPDHGTVAARIQSAARAEHIPYFRGSHHTFRASRNQWLTPQSRPDGAPYGMSTRRCFRINETGLCLMTDRWIW